MAIECVVGKRRHGDGKMVTGWLVREWLEIECVVGKRRHGEWGWDNVQRLAGAQVDGDGVRGW